MCSSELEIIMGSAVTYVGYPTARLGTYRCHAVTSTISTTEPSKIIRGYRAEGLDVLSGAPTFSGKLVFVPISSLHVVDLHASGNLQVRG